MWYVWLMTDVKGLHCLIDCTSMSGIILTVKDCTMGEWEHTACDCMDIYWIVNRLKYWQRVMSY